MIVGWGNLGGLPCSFFFALTHMSMEACLSQWFYLLVFSGFLQSTIQCFVQRGYPPLHLNPTIRSCRKVGRSACAMPLMPGKYSSTAILKTYLFDIVQLRLHRNRSKFKRSFTIEIHYECCSSLPIKIMMKNRRDPVVFLNSRLDLQNISLMVQILSNWVKCPTAATIDLSTGHGKTKLFGNNNHGKENVDKVMDIPSLLPLP